MEGHLHHRVAIGTEHLSPGWIANKKQFRDAESAQTYLNDFTHDHSAIQTLRTIGRSLSNGMLMPTSDNVAITAVAAALVDGRAWAIELPRSSPKSRFVSKTSPEAFAPINPRLGTKVDFAFIASLEGDQWLRGYVPMSKGKVIGQSGMTVASGFDLGQWSVTDFQNFGFSKQLLDKIKPFASNKFKGLTKAQVIAKLSKLAPVPELSKSEADACDAAVFGKILEDAIKLWTKLAHNGVPPFTALPAGWQTVWLSRIYQEGSGPQNGNAFAFRDSALSGRWQMAIASLRSYTKYASRANQEADLLTRELPAPVASPLRPAP